MPVVDQNGNPHILCSQHSFINKKLPVTVPIDSNSASYVTSLVNQVYGHGTIAAFNARDWTAPIYVADENTPRHTVTIDRPSGQADELKGVDGPFYDVPIPDDARPAGPWPGDNHLTIYSPIEDSYWEMWKASFLAIDGPHSGGQAAGTDPAVLNTPGWHCEYGGGVQRMGNSTGVFDSTSWKGIGGGHGARATKLQIAPGLISRYEGLQALVGAPNAIPHAIHTALPTTAANIYRWPATATDGSGASTEPTAGMIFRLPPEIDLSALQSAHPFVYALCVAIRDYGMVISDTSGTVAFYCESRGVAPGTQDERLPDVWLGPDDTDGPFPLSPPAIFDDHAYGNSSNTFGMLQHIPWSSLQVVDASYRPTAPIKTHFLVGTT